MEVGRRVDGVERARAEKNESVYLTGIKMISQSPPAIMDFAVVMRLYKHPASSLNGSR